MLNNYKNRKESGFTIIEVLIVLAIAGLIMLVVFLAVPALQRSSRNSQAKSEAANVGGAINEYISNNNGKVPPAGDATVAARIIKDANTKTLTTLVVEANSQTAMPTETTARLQANAKCSAGSGADVNSVREAGNSSRQQVLLYQTEKAGGVQVSCTDI